MRARRAGAPRTRSTARLGAGCGAIAVGVLLALLAAFAPAAGASFAQIRAEVGCDRQVRWSASAGTEGTDVDRTHDAVRVERRYGDGPWEPVGPDVSFDPANRFTAQGSFALPEDVDAVALRVQPTGPWASGSPPGDARYGEARLPDACAAAPIAVTRRFDCDVEGLVIVARSLAEHPLPLDVRIDDSVVHSAELAAGSTSEVVLPLLGGSESRLGVDSGEVRLVDDVIRSECDPRTERTAVGVLRRCTPGTGVLTARGGVAESRVDVLVGGELVARESLPAEAALRRVFSVADPSAPIEVSVDGQRAALGPLGPCDSPVAGVLQCSGDGAGPCTDPVPLDAAAAEQPGDRALTDPASSVGIESLPSTGPLQRAVLLAAAALLLVVGGGAVVASDRSIREVSLLQSSVDQYRQRWWSDR